MSLELLCVTWGFFVLGTRSLGESSKAPAIRRTHDSIDEGTIRIHIIPHLVTQDSET